MPRPVTEPVANSQNKIEFASAQEASVAFEEHLKAITFAFQSLQQRHYELLRETSGNELDEKIFSAPPDSHGIMHTLKPTEERLQLPSQHVRRNSQLEPQGGHHKNSQISLHEDQGARRMLHHQFLRLDMNGSGSLDEFDLVSHMSSFGAGMELQDLPAMIATTVSLSGGTNPEELDFDGFVTLMLDESLVQDPTPKSMQRDVKNLRQCLQSEDETNLYASDGHIETSPSAKGPSPRMATLYEWIMTTVIAANAVTMGLSTDYAIGHVAWDVVNAVFCLFYVGEAVSKLCFYGPRWYFFGPEPALHAFDFICMLLTVAEVNLSLAVRASASEAETPFGRLMWVRALRLVRLVRIIRAARVTVFKELKLMVGGVMAGVKVLGWALVVLFVLVYVFAVAFRDSLDEPEFRDMQSSMFTLFRCFTEGCAAYDGTPLTERLRNKYGALFVGSYIMMWLVVCLGIFNLVAAIFIDDVANTQVDRKIQEMAKNANAVEVAVKEHLLRLILQSRATGVPSEVEKEIADMATSFTSQAARVRAQFQCLADSNIVIARSAFQTYMSDPKFINALHLAEIETSYGGVYDFLDADMGGWLSVSEVYEGLMSLRGPVNKAEVVGLRLKIRHMVKMMHAQGWAESRV